MDRKLYVGALTDNRRWDALTIRSDDVFVVTPPKCGTTWMQTIVALLFSGDPEVETELSVKMPWVDIRFRDMADVAERLESMKDRRSMKSHTPIDGLPFHPDAQYLCVFRHSLDAHFSLRKHIANMPINPVELFFPQGDEQTMFNRFLDGADEGFDLDAMPLATIVKHFKTAQALQDRPNVTLFHYADMKRDLAGTFARVADLLNITHSAATMKALVQAATFDNMKSNAHRFAPSGGKGFFLSDSEFFNSGSNNKWVGELTTDQLEAYDYVIDGMLTPKERHWLEFGAVNAGFQDSLSLNR